MKNTEKTENNVTTAKSSDTTMVSKMHMKDEKKRKKRIERPRCKWNDKMGEHLTEIQLN